MTGPAIDGMMTLSWTENGQKFRQDIKQTASVGKQKRTMETWTLGDGSYVYSYQPMMGKQVARLKVPKSAGPAGHMAG